MREQSHAAQRHPSPARQLRFSLQALRPYPRQDILVLLTTVLDVGFTVTFFYGIKLLVDASVGSRDQGTMVQVVAGLAAFYVVTSVANVAREHWLSDVEMRLATDLRLSMLAHLQRLGLDYHRWARTSDLQTRFSSDVITIKNALTKSLPTVIRYGLQVVAVTVLLFFLDWQLALVVLLALGLTVLAVRILAERANRLGPRHSRDESAVLATVQDMISGHLIYKVFGFQRQALERFEQQLARLAVSGAGDSARHRMITRAIESMAALTQLVVSVAGVWLIYHHSLTVGTLTAFIGLLGVLATALIRVALGLPDWLSSVGALERVQTLLAEQPTVTDTPSASPLPPIALEIRFERVSFRYSGELFATRDVSFTISVGQSVAIVGRNGSGKSTLLYLMLRLWDPVEGRITIDGHDLRAVTHNSLFAQFGVVFQDVLLLNATIRENIRVGRPQATDAEVEAAASSAGLHDAVAAMPLGYETIVGEHGRYLSGGQRQRIALARALVRKPRVLILDEATSALDTSAETAFNETLQQLATAHTLIAVTHRLANVVHADQIVVVEGGRLAECGRHEELLARGGIYHDLWDRQAGFIISKGGREARVTIQRLRRIPLFGGLDDAHLTLLSDQFTSELTVAGQVLTEEGDIGDTFHVIVRGTADVLRNTAGGERTIDRLQDGDYFGEIALLAETPRTATVRARTPCLLLTLARDQFDALVSSSPQVRDMMEELMRERLGNIEAASRSLA